MNPDWQLNGEEQIQRLTRVLGERIHTFDAQGLAESVMGDRLFANMILLGAAWQQGGIPLSLAALHRAIELNGVAVARNRQAFDLGRLAIADPGAAPALSGGRHPAEPADRRAQTLDDVIALRMDTLSAYKNAAFARTYANRIAELRARDLPEAAVMAVARGLFKLMAVKDEWEVARLYSKPSFRQSLAETFDGDMELTFHFGAWPYGRTDPQTGKPVKGAVKGKTALRFFRLLDRLRGLRGSLLDPFRNSDEAKLARRLLAEYQADIDFALNHWDTARTETLTELLDLPEHIRGYGPVRERHAAQVATRRAALHARILSSPAKAA